MGFWRWFFPTSDEPEQQDEGGAAPRPAQTDAAGQQTSTRSSTPHDRQRAQTQQGEGVVQAEVGSLTDQTGALTAQRRLQNLYLDFERNRETLQEELVRLKGRHRDAFFPGVPDAQLLDRFIERFFPEGFPAHLLVSNVSHKPDAPFLLVRPAQLSPAITQVMPRGLVLAVKGGLWDNFRDPDNPVLRVFHIVDLTHSEARDFERELRVCPYYSNIYPSRVRNNNCLTQEFVSSLPPIHRQTGRKLGEWLDYVEFRRRLARASAQGLRFVDLEITEDGLARFLLVAPSQEEFDRCWHRLRGQELSLFPLGYSTDEWQFRPREDSRARPLQMGPPKGGPERVTEIVVPGCPWHEPYAAAVTLLLDDELQDEFDELRHREGEERARAWVRSRLPGEGFLGISIVGDLALVGRFERALRTLQEQGGYAPFLSSYLFDIKTARVPRQLDTVDQWGLQELNDAQKHAVRVMLSAPDIALVQGPPGTGKTTVIAEAAYQFVRRGMRVLIASQANLAVDNALERLPLVPEIRAVRLGSKGDEELPFSEKNALATYYRAIATRCRSQTLDPWDTAQRQANAARRWLDDYRVVRANVEEAEQRARRIRSQLDDLRRQLHAAERHLRQIEQQEKFGEVVRSLADALRNGDPDAVPAEVPDSVVSDLVKSVLQPLIDALRRGGLRVPTLLGHITGATAAGLLRDLLTRLRKFEGYRHQINADMHGLSQLSGNIVLGTAEQIELDNLRRQRDELLQRIATDASVVAELQRVQKRIVELESKGGGASIGSAYASIFANPDALGGGKTPRQLLNVLRDALKALDDAQAVLKRARSAFVPWLCQQVTPQTAAKASAEARRRQLEGRIRGEEVNLRDAEEYLQAQRERLRELVEQAVSNWNVDRNWSVEEIARGLEGYLQRLEQQLNATATTRTQWEPFLRWWTRELEDAQRAERDAPFYKDEFIARCNVVGVSCTESPFTLESAGHPWFDVVIVDEVSKATPPELLIPLLRGRKAILVGDHRQLPPLFREGNLSWEEVAADLAQDQSEGQGEEGAGTQREFTVQDFDRFRRMVTSSLFKELFEQAPDQLKAMLTVQYRMHPKIMDVVNYFYDHLLVCGLEDPDASRPDSDPRSHRRHRLRLVGPNGEEYLREDLPVVWIDSSRNSNGAPVYEELISASKVNEWEATIIAHILCDLEEALRSQGYTGDNPKRVGVVSFYGAQIGTIRRAINNVRLQRGTVFNALRWDVNTVDRYQGKERPIIIVSLVRAPKGRLSPRALTAQFQRINVAMSRAQELLIVVGNRRVFESYPVDLPYVDRPGSRRFYVYREIVNYIQRLGGLWPAREVVRG